MSLGRPLSALLMISMLAGAGCAQGDNPGASQASPRSAKTVVPGPSYRPAIDPEDFVEGVDNPYFPLRPGARLVYEGVSEGDREVDRVTVTDQTKEIMGVTATVVHDQVFTDGELTEDTFDWYAQDRAGNVWYFGENTKELEGGKVTSTKGSWEAGVDGAQPGILMLGRPQVGDAYRQEYFKGEAEDLGRVKSLDGSVSVPYGSFDDVLVTEDSTPLEPKILENKFYAPGVGVVMEELVKGGHEVLKLVDVKAAEG